MTRLPCARYPDSFATHQEILAAVSLLAVSVVMPVRDAADTVVRAARSILDGTLSAIELIVVDDGSHDATAQLVAELGDARVRVLRGPREGIVAALNRGVAAAGAPVIARMDGDDVAAPDRLERQWALLRRGEAAIVGSRVRIVDGQGRPVASMQRYEQWINDHCLASEIAALRFVESPLVHPTVVARREVFALGYRQGPFPEDYDLWLRALAAGHRAVKVPDILLDWVDRGDRLTRRDTRYGPDAFDRCRREHLLAGPLRGIRTVDLWGAGKTGKPWLRWLQGHVGSVRHVYDINPRIVGQCLHGVHVDDGDRLRPADGTPMIVAVGASGARELIRPALEGRGYQIGHDVWFVA